MVDTMNEHRLTGCRPVPLAHYLKALGILRLVAEQVDAVARGFWDRDVFVLQTRLSREELEAFFRERYAPTPIVGPWGARSGFFPGSSETSAREALEAIVAATGAGASTSAPHRLAHFRATILTVRNLLDSLGIHEKEAVKDRKAELMQACRARLPDDVVGWLDACYVLTSEGTRFPPILGTGGNEGSGSYVSLFAQYVVACMLERKHDHALAQALWDQAAADVPGAVPGHFSPGAAAGNVRMTPWEYLLCLEGALLFAAALVRRGEELPGGMAAPFTVRAVSAGYGSAAPEKSRGEMWLPLWRRPVSLAELMHVLREGRVEIGGRAARNGTDFARAIATLGVDRGITAFQRYGFHERNGLSYFATPLDRMAVAHRPGVTLLGEIDAWLDRFRRQAGGDRAPATAGRALRQLDEAILELCRRDDEPRLRAVLLALGRCERMMARSRRWAKESALTPVPRLSKDWLLRCGSSVELRLAAALASVRARYGARWLWLRQHLSPVQVQMQRDQQLRIEWNEGADRDVVWMDDLVESLTQVMHRRLLVAEQAGVRTHIDGGVISADLRDIVDFIEGHTDDRMLADLVWGCTLLDWAQIGEAGVRPPARPESESSTNPDDEPWPGTFYGVLKLCFAGREVRKIDVPLVPRIQRLAAVGRGYEASRDAVRRLRGSGLVPLVSAVDARGHVAKRAAAALMFPLGRRSIDTLARRILKMDEAVRAASPPDDMTEQGVEA